MDYSAVTESINNILANPRAAELYKSNYSFRLGIRRSLQNLSTSSSKSTSSEKALADILSKFSFEIKDNKLKIKFGPMGTYFDTIDEATSAALTHPTLRATRGYGSDQLFDSVGYESNEIANKVFGKRGYKTRVSTYNVTDQAEFDQFKSAHLLGKDKDGYNLYNGLVRPKKGAFDVMQVFRPDGSELGTQEILDEILQTSEFKSSWVKRMSFLFSNRGMVLAGLSESQMPVVHLFDPKEMLQKIVGNETLGSIDKFFPDAADAEKAFSGMNFMTRAGHRRLLNKMRDEAQRDIDRGGQWAKLGRKRFDLINKQLEDSSGGYYLQMQGGRNSRGGVLRGMKSDVAVLTAAEEERWQSLTGLSKKELDQIDFLTSSADIKTEVETKLGFVSLDPRAKAHKARSNLFATVTHQNLLADESFYTESTIKEMSGHLADLKAGKFSPGLVAALREIANESIEPDTLATMGHAEIMEFQQSQRFAKRIIGTIESGGDLSNVDSLLMQASNALKKHYTRTRKGKGGKTLLHRGKEGPYYAMDSAVRGGLRAHISISSDPFAIPNKIGVDAGGRWGMTTVDNLMYYASSGGGDADDEFMSHQLSYDPATKRVFLPIDRAPTELAEIRFADAHLASLTFDELVPPEIRDLDFRIQEINKFIRSEKRKGISALGRQEQKQILTLMRERDQLVTQVTRFFEGKSVTIKSGKSISKVYSASEVKELSSHVRHFNFGEIFNPDSGLPAPKGFARTAEAAANYSRLSFDRSYATEAQMIGKPNKRSVFNRVRSLFEVMDEDEALDQSIQFTGRLPYEFKGLDYSEFHDIYFPNRIKPSATDIQFEKERYNEFLDRRLRGEVASAHKLGVAANAQTALDATIQSHLHSLSPEARSIFLKHWEEAAMQTAGREDIIDASVKTMDEEFLEKVDQMVVSRFRDLGSSLAKSRMEIGASAGADIVGIDPMQFERLIKPNQAAARALTEGWNSIIDDPAQSLFLSPDDPKSYMSRAYDRTKQFLEFWEKEEADIAPAARARHLASLERAGLEFSGEEMSRASEILDSAIRVQKEAQKFINLGSEELLSVVNDMFEAGEIDLDVSSEIIRKMHLEYGLFKEVTDPYGVLKLQATEASQRQILAMSKVLAENGGTQQILQAVSQAPGVLGVGQLYDDAIQELVTSSDIYDEIAHFTAEDVLENVHIRYVKSPDLGREAVGIELKKRKNIFKAVDQDRAMWDIDARIQSLMFQDITEEQRKNLQTITDLFMDGRFRSYNKDRLRQTAPTYGAKRFARREASDIVADGVVTPRPVRTLMERASLQSESVQALMKEPVFRRSAIGIAALAGFGVIHRLAKDPSEDDLKGPPLLPGGSAYEGYNDINPSDMSSIYSSIGFQNQSQGMLYQIRMSGQFNPSDFTKEISAVTGTSVSGNIYSARQTTSNRLSSRAKLNELMG